MASRESFIIRVRCTLRDLLRKRPSPPNWTEILGSIEEVHKLKNPLQFLHENKLLSKG